MMQLTIEDSMLYRSMSRKNFPYGRGDAAIQIVSILEAALGQSSHWKDVPDFVSNLPGIYPKVGLGELGFQMSNESHF